jgi:acyl-CoA dehydrogenase
MTDSDRIIIDTATRIFQDLGAPQAIVNAADDSWKTALWDTLEEAGLTQTWTPDDLGGAGAGITDGFDVLRVAGQYAVSLPLAETLLAGWLLSKAGIVVPQGAMTVAPARPADRIELQADGTLRGTARKVPFAGAAERIAVLARRGGETEVALVDAADCEISAGASLAGDPLDTVRFDGVRPAEVEAADVDEDALFQMGAAARASQIAGALRGILDISVDYAQERMAFGRPIGKFQAVQHMLARLGGETAASIAAAGSVADRIARSDAFDDCVFVEVASAKTRTGEAAGEGAAIGHQVHGAIGFTDEHVLHRYTMRLWSWREDFGSESVWAVRLGEMVAARGADGLWPLVTAQ